jgi:hypothetical protein
VRVRLRARVRVASRALSSSISFLSLPTSVILSFLRAWVRGRGRGLRC